jgi:hypothetical protein
MTGDETSLEPWSQKLGQRNIRKKMGPIMSPGLLAFWEASEGSKFGQF